MAIGDTVNEHSVNNSSLVLNQKPANCRFPSLKVIPINDQIIELQTIIRDKYLMINSFDSQ